MSVYPKERAYQPPALIQESVLHPIDDESRQLPEGGKNEFQNFTTIKSRSFL
jgi:hypothetical protein